ncbi:hypothetical protein NEIELOOT_01890 [Neisseria elongata subsp. glycolytica ATCC 29315]|uniref:Uncharacterized protein n=1 Tax=Neisseria elongata subsp. glycolytica ATCC 29315 TaxID=546263 RepID=D4DS47_NEIEG|nr:hypothetical protein NEIELOOT_01890 [Neisseria elongata subsp. glycolytica ATCC 29315]
MRCAASDRCRAAAFRTADTARHSLIVFVCPLWTGRLKPKRFVRTVFRRPIADNRPSEKYGKLNLMYK